MNSLLYVLYSDSRRRGEQGRVDTAPSVNAAEMRGIRIVRWSVSLDCVYDGRNAVAVLAVLGGCMQ